MPDGQDSGMLRIIVIII